MGYTYSLRLHTSHHIDLLAVLRKELAIECSTCTNFNIEDFSPWRRKTHSGPEQW